MSRGTSAPENMLRLAADPTGPNLRAGDVYYNTVNDRLRMYDGTYWIDAADFAHSALQMSANARRSRSGYSEVAARAVDQVKSFNSWLTQQAWAAQTGWVGETGIPNGLTSIASSALTIAVDEYMGVLELVTTIAEEFGMGVIYWDCDECTVEALSMYGSDPQNNPAGGGALTGPLRKKYPTSALLESHLTNTSNLQYPNGPFHGIALKDGFEGVSSASAATSTFSNSRETRTFNVDEGITPGTEYNYGRQESYQFLNQNKVVFIRLPVRWERIQRTLGGNLDATEMARIDQAIGWAQLAGCKIIFDIHNSGSYFLDDGTQGVRKSIGGGGTAPTQAHFVDLWTKIASHYATIGPGLDASGLTGRNDLRSTLVGYELMNEPLFYTQQDGSGSTSITTGPGRTAGTAANRWAEAANAAGQAIRTLDSTISLIVHPYGGGGAGATFWQYHYDGPFMYASGGATGQGNTNFQTNVVYIAHLYYNAAATGTYTIETYRANVLALAGEAKSTSPGAAYVPFRKQRAIGAYIADGCTLVRRMAVVAATGAGYSSTLLPNNQAAPTLVASGLTDVYTPSNVYGGVGAVGPRTLIIPSMYAVGASGNTMEIYVRPPGQTASTKNVAWLRAVLTISAAGTAQLLAPTFIGPGSTLVVNCSAANMALAFPFYEVTDSELVVVSSTSGTTQMAANTDKTLYTVPAGCMARVVNQASASPVYNGWAGINTTGSGVTGAAASSAITVQAKVKPNGYGASAAFPLGTALSTAGNTLSGGPGGIFAGVPSSIIDFPLAGGDQLILNPNAVGMNVWALLEVQGQ